MTTEELIHDLRQLGKYSTLEPNWYLLSADKIEELSSKQIKTNYDRIRNMSVEEMADFISCIYADNDHDEIRVDGKWMLDIDIESWLESEVQGE